MLEDTLRSDLTTALKSRDEVTLATLRMLMAALKEASVAGKTAHALADDEVRRVIAREAKKRDDAIEAYTAASRPELAAREAAEKVVLARYLPTPLSTDEVTALVATTLAEGSFTSLSQMGPAMKAVQAVLAGRADGKLVASLVRSSLS